MGKHKTTVGSSASKGPTYIADPFAQSGGEQSPADAQQEAADNAADAEGADFSASQGGPGAGAVQMYTKEGNPVKVDPSLVRDTFMAGRTFFAPGQTVHVKDQRGRIFQVGSDKAAQAFQSGMGLATEEDVKSAVERQQQNTLGKSAEALGVGAVRGLTMGLSDPLAIGAAGAIGGEETGKAVREHLHALAEHHPIASTVGEVGGAIAPVLLSGGAAAGAEGAVEGGGLLARGVFGAGILPRLTAHAGELAGEGVAHLVGEGATSVLGRVAQRAIPMAAQAGTEGALYGIGNTISEAALGDEELTAEKLISGAAHGAKLGAITGGVLGGGYELGKAALDKGFQLAGKEGLEQWLQSVADNQTVKALGANSRDIRNLGGAGRSVEQAKDRVAEIADTVRNYKFENGEKLFSGTSTTSKLADGLEEAVDDAGAKLGKFRQKVAAITGEHAELGPDVAGLLKQIDETVLTPAREAGGTLGKRAALAESELGSLREMAAKGEPVPIEDLTKARQRIDKVLYPKKVMGVPPPPVEHFELLQQARQLIEEHVEQVTDRALSSVGNAEMAGAYKSLKDTFRNLSDAKAMAGAADMRALARNTVGLGDKMAASSAMAGALASGANPLIAGAHALGTGVINHLVTDRGNAMLAAAAEKAAALIKMQRITSHVDESLGNSITAFLNDHAEVAELAEKGAHVAREVTKTAIEKAPTLKHPQEGDYEETVHAVGERAANEHATMGHIADAVGPIAKHAPNVANNIVQKLDAHTQWLQQNIPHPSYPSGFPMAPQPHASADPLKQLEYTQKVRAVQAPVQTVTANLKSGSLTHAHMAAVRATSPKLAQDIEKRVLEGAVELKAKGKSMGFDQRMQAGIVLGKPIEPTAAPRFVATVQKLHQEAAQAKAEQNQQRGAPKRQLDMVGQHKSFSDRIGRTEG